MKESRSIKIYADTYRRLKVLAARLGVTLTALIERLAREEEAKQDAS